MAAPRQRAQDSRLVPVQMDNPDCVLLEQPREPPCRVKHHQVAARQDHRLRAHGARLRGKLAVVEQDQQYPSTARCQTGNHSQHMALDAAEQLADRADGDAFELRRAR